jgi:hypothetical protein
VPTLSIISVNYKVSMEFVIYFLSALAILLPIVAIINMLRNVRESHLYWKDAIDILRKLRKSLIDLQGDDFSGILRFDLDLEKLSNSAKNYMSLSAKALAYSIRDAKGVFCNEYSLMSVVDTESVKKVMNDELIKLAGFIESKDAVRAIDQVGNMYLVAKTHEGIRNSTINEPNAFSFDTDVVKLLIDFSQDIYCGADRALIEELGDLIENLSNNGMNKLSPASIFILFWLRKELIAMQLWEPEKNNKLLRNIWSSRDEILSYSLASIAVAIAEGDQEAFANEIIHYNSSKKVINLLPKIMLPIYRQRVSSLV